MELKEGRMYLGRLQKIDRTLQRKIWQLEECRASLLPRAIQYGKAKVKMPPKDYILETEAKIEELETEIERLKADKRKVLLEITDTIESIDDEMCKTILTRVFVRGERALVIAKQMHYSRQGIYTIINRGIRQIKE